MRWLSMIFVSVIFYYTNMGVAFHGAIYIGNNLVIHAFVDLGVILSSIDDVLFYDAKGKSRLRAVYRFRKGGK